MRNTTIRRSITGVLAVSTVGAALAAETPARQRSPEGVKAPRRLEQAGPDLPASEPPAATVVSYNERELVGVKTKLRFTTLIVLPESERILDVTCGDKEFWVVNGNENLAYVKPAKPGAETNLNLITASGNIYSFVLTEVSNQPTLHPDLKVFVELREGSMAKVANGSPRFVSADALKDYRQQVEAAKDEARQTKQSAQAAIDAGISRFINNVRFPYKFEAGRKPFYVRAMYHDDKFTYIQARPEETPALYETKDGKPNLINFDYQNGVYVVRKILDRGYFMIGKQKLAFEAEQ